MTESDLKQAVGELLAWRQVASNAEAEVARLRASAPTHVYLVQWSDWEESVIYGAHLNREDADVDFDRRVSEMPGSPWTIRCVPLGGETYDGEQVRGYMPAGWGGKDWDEYNNAHNRPAPTMEEP